MGGRVRRGWGPEPSATETGSELLMSCKPLDRSLSSSPWPSETPGYTDGLALSADVGSPLCAPGPGLSLWLARSGQADAGGLGLQAQHLSRQHPQRKSTSTGAISLRSPAGYPLGACWPTRGFWVGWPSFWSGTSSARQDDQTLRRPPGTLGPSPYEIPVLWRALSWISCPNYLGGW